MPDRLRNAMLGPTLEAGLRWRTHEPRMAARVPTDVDVVVVGPGSQEPVEEAQRWFRSDRGLVVLIVVEADRRAAVEEGLLAAPCVGKAVRIVSTHDTHAFAETVERARRHKKVRRRAADADRLVERAHELI